MDTTRPGMTLRTCVPGSARCCTRLMVGRGVRVKNSAFRWKEDPVGAKNALQRQGMEHGILLEEQDIMMHYVVSDAAGLCRGRN